MTTRLLSIRASALVCLFMQVVLLRCKVQSIVRSSSIDDIDKHVNRNLQQVILQVTAIQLVNAVSNASILNITNNTVINLATLPTTSVTIVALTSNNVESVVFGLNTNDRYTVKSAPPFSMCGNELAVLFPCVWLVVGTHKVTVTPFSKNYSVSTNGTARTVTFTVVNSPAETCKIPKFVDATWETVTPAYPISVAEPHGQLIGDDLVIFSGFVFGLVNVVNQTYARDVTKVNSPWRRMEDVPIPIGISHTPTVVIGKKVVMCGGYLGGVPGPHVANCFIYNHEPAPGSNQWARLPQLPDGGSAGAGMIYDSETRTIFYVSGSKRPILGKRDSFDINTVWKLTFSIGKREWLASTPIPFKSNHMSSVTNKVTGKERHFFMGGQIGENEHTGNLPDMYEFVVATESWIRRTSMPMGRGHAMSSTRPIGCGFIIASGSVNTATLIKNRTADISYYDIPSNSWTSIGSVVYGMVTPIVDIDRNGYMHFVDTKVRSFRRRISF